MIDCLAATGSVGAIPVLTGGLLLVAAVVGVLAHPSSAALQQQLGAFVAPFAEEHAP